MTHPKPGSGPDLTSKGATSEPELLVDPDPEILYRAEDGTLFYVSAPQGKNKNWRMVTTPSSAFSITEEDWHKYNGAFEKVDATRMQAIMLHMCWKGKLDKAASRRGVGPLQLCLKRINGNQAARKHTERRAA